jgi:hypothetical protein
MGGLEMSQRGAGASVGRGTGDAIFTLADASSPDVRLLLRLTDLHLCRLCLLRVFWPCVFLEIVRTPSLIAA